MFISRINKNFKFNQEKWLISVVSLPAGNDDVYKASIVIEGVVHRKLLFACYDIFSKVCEKSSEDQPRAYIHLIDCFESSRYRGNFHACSASSYHALPSECQKLSDHIHGIAALFEEKENAVAPELIIFPVSVEKASLQWCHNFLGEHHILHRSGAS